MKKILLAITIAAISIIVFAFALSMRHEPYVGWGYTLDMQDRIYQFTKYKTPEQYKLIDYYDNFGNLKVKYDQKIVVYQDKVTDQNFMIFQLNEIRNGDLESIKIQSKDLWWATVNHLAGMRPHSKFSNIMALKYKTSLFVDTNFSEEIAPFEIRKILNPNPSYYESDYANILVIEAEFKELGFKRQSNSWFRKYPIPVFSFHSPVHGALAVLQNKKTNKLVFALGFNSLGNPYDHAEFIDILHTVDFEPRPGSWFGKEFI